MHAKPAYPEQGTYVHCLPSIVPLTVHITPIKLTTKLQASASRDICSQRWKLGMGDGNMPFQHTAGLYGAAAILRLALFTFFPALPDLLTNRVEVSTPVTSFKRCKTTPGSVGPWLYGGMVYEECPC